MPSTNIAEIVARAKKKRPVNALMPFWDFEIISQEYSPDVRIAIKLVCSIEDADLA